MSDILIGTLLVLVTVAFLLLVLGGTLVLGRLFSATLRRARSPEPAVDREIAQLLAETDPHRRR